MFYLDHVQIAIPRGQEEEARRFYRDIVGLSEIDKPEALRHRGGVWFELGNNQLHLGVADPFAPAKKAHPGINCTELETLADRLRLAGIPVTWDGTLGDRRRLYTQDPFGNRLEFIGSSTSTERG
jgi:catechol 2,3-dioxygenase-like lactoylglutathione lyase family enzyme